MAALSHFRYMTGRVRLFLYHNPDILPARVLATIAAEGGFEVHAEELGFDRDVGDLMYLAVFVIECVRLVCLGRGNVPYGPNVPFR
jgi:hypothetical protein